MTEDVKDVSMYKFVSEVIKRIADITTDAESNFNNRFIRNLLNSIFYSWNSIILKDKNYIIYAVLDFPACY